MNNNVNANAKKLRFYEREYKPGDVSGQLLNKKYDFIAALDYGDGEIVWKIYDLRPTADNCIIEPRSLRLDEKYNYKIPTCFYPLEENKVSVGYSAIEDARNDASTGKKLEQNFKSVPCRWQKNPENEERKRMRIFLKTLWDNVRNYDADYGKNLENARKDGKLCICVGCPADENWTGTNSMCSYAELVKEATGCASVLILPESTAAIMGELFTKKTAGEIFLDVSRGIAIYDFGSSTIDFTYIYMGKTLCTRSLQLGGRDVDDLMLARILANFKCSIGGKEYSLTEKDLTSECIARLKIQIRGEKEKFYPKMAKQLPQLLNIGRKDDIKKDTKIAQALDAAQVSVLKIEYDVDRDFMDKVLTDDCMPKEEFAGKKWMEELKKFIDETLSAIPCILNQNGQLVPEVGTVILTGGTSHIPAIREAVQAVYPCPVEQSSKPSESVALGLCYAVANEISANGYYEEAINNLKEPYELKEPFEAAYKVFAEKVGDHIARIAWKHAGEAVKTFNDGKDHRIREIINEIQTEVAKDPELQPQKFKEFIEKSWTASVSPAQDAVRKKVNAIAGRLYGNGKEERIVIPQIPSHNFGAGVWGNDGVNYQKLFNNVILKNSFFQKIPLYILKAILWGTGLVIGVIFPPSLIIIGPVLLILDSLLTEKKNNNIVNAFLKQQGDTIFPARFCAMLARNFKKSAGKSREFKQMKADMIKSFETNGIKESFLNFLKEDFEVALGVILLMVFEG